MTDEELREAVKRLQRELRRMAAVHAIRAAAKDPFPSLPPYPFD